MPCRPHVAATDEETHEGDKAWNRKTGQAQGGKVRGRRVGGGVNGRRQPRGAGGLLPRGGRRNPRRQVVRRGPSRLFRRRRRGLLAGIGQLAACSPTGPPSSMAPRVGRPSTSRSSASHPVSMGAGIGWWRPTAASSPSATRPSRDRRGPSTSTHPSSGLVPTPDGQGYWLVASDGGVFSFGDASFYGSEGGTKLNQPIVGMAATKDGRGYWLVAADGGVFSFGDAPFYGSLGAKTLNAPIAAIAPARNGNGYVLAARDGGVFTFGASAFYGSAAGQANAPVTGVAGTFFGNGYTLTTSNGGVYNFGDSSFCGVSGNASTNSPIVGPGVLLRTLQTLIDPIHSPSKEQSMPNISRRHFSQERIHRGRGHRRRRRGRTEPPHRGLQRRCGNAVKDDRVSGPALGRIGRDRPRRGRQVGEDLAFRRHQAHRIHQPGFGAGASQSIQVKARPLPEFVPTHHEVN